jgi:tRNA wybutosine-synthesizing protein 1
MEATPAVACANKCTFCWRQNSHPVSISWKPYQIDEPQDIFDGMLKAHAQLVKQLKGADVSETNFAEAVEHNLKPKHAALSLVGEPVFYPRINELVDMLHAETISTFLVTNGQFPEALRALKPITQLYLSVDASNAMRWKELDRPLFVDYWERFHECLEIIKQRQLTQRTVCRMTLIKGKNMENVEEYAELFMKAAPGFIELKGVTFAAWDKETTGLSNDDNVPWHEEVMLFARQLEKVMRPHGYEIACVHEHSCSVLLARTDLYKVDGEWHTWIDYDKFAAFPNSPPTEFRVRTPHWALYGSDTQGFNPEHRRHRPPRQTPEEVLQEVERQSLAL